MIAIINLETINETGNRRIANRFAAERDRVESFNRHMVMAMMPHRTAPWKGIVAPQHEAYITNFNGWVAK
jgi:hypothetical protein